MLTVTNDFPGQPTAHAIAAASPLGAEDAWSSDPAVIAAASGDLLALLNFYHGDDNIEREVHHGR